MLESGTKAPDFELPDQNGEMHKLSDYAGKKVILYFYPKDNTAGCFQNKYLWIINNIIPSVHHFLQARKAKYSIHIEIDIAFTGFNSILKM